MSLDAPGLTVAAEDQAYGAWELQCRKRAEADWEHHAPVDVHTTTCERCAATIHEDQALVDGYADSGRYLALCCRCAAQTKQSRWQLTPEAQEERRRWQRGIRQQVQADYERFRREHPMKGLDYDEFLAEREAKRDDR